MEKETFEKDEVRTTSNIIQSPRVSEGHFHRLDNDVEREKIDCGDFFLD